ncbi:hypothetical protein JL100_035140 (plasmid) [Skermanella mucosa]|uniref:hypothetical protein n=1 Tax=Skermanella mucosa TaxID=1789672 RepID=UPI00192B6EB4|nr:hypothetical protein [Skermanella mucosa]UEM25297.1 hypothetical protein JL100_035140 [Skermanella mucosa]
MGYMTLIGGGRAFRAGLAAGLLAAAAGFAGGYWLGDRNSRERTRVVATSCGVAPADAPFYLPLRTLQEEASHVPLLIGPIRIPGVPTAVKLRFDPALDGTGDTVTKLGDVLHLPKFLGERPEPPKEIRLACRDGTLTTVQYLLDDASTTFAVMRRDDRNPATGS